MRKKNLRMGIVTVLMGVGLLCGGDCLAGSKSPTFQVRGGSVFTYNGVTTMVEQTRKINGVDAIFSSWVEQGAFSNGYMNSGFISGAAIGVGFDAGSTGDFCTNRTALSFANSSNNNGNCFTASNSNQPLTGNLGYNFPTFNIGTSISRAKSSGGTVDERLGSATLRGGTIGIGDYQVIIVNGDADIENNYIYGDGYFTSLEQVPKLLIYATNSINIHCSVSRVDAILFAGGDVNTCSDVENVNAEERSRQLVINGAIVAGGTVNFQRTYGAVWVDGDDGATPVNQEVADFVSKCQTSDRYRRYCASVPAEIVNYDTSILSTSSKANMSETTSNLMTIYQRELPPRY